MTESLTLNELREIAGCKTRLSLIRWLDRVGWVYTLNARSEPIVGRAYLRGRFLKARKLSGVNFEFRDLRPMGLTAQPSLRDAMLLGGHTNEAITKRVYRRAGERAKPNE